MPLCNRSFLNQNGERFLEVHFDHGSVYATYSLVYLVGIYVDHIKQLVKLVDNIFKRFSNQHGSEIAERNKKIIKD